MMGFDIEQEWTAVRCQRLLRPLASKLAVFSREASRLSTRELSSRSSYNTKGPSSSLWVHNRVKKRARRTYTTKVADDRKHKTFEPANHPGFRRAGILQPGGVDVPTPVIRSSRMMLDSPRLLSEGRAGNQVLQPPHRSKESYGFKETFDARLSKKLRELRRNTPPSLYNTYEGVCSALEALLRLTHSQPSSKRDHRTLLSTCLRAVPAHIKGQQLLVDAKAKTQGVPLSEVTNVTTQTYESLEALGSSTFGWRHLRTVVRAHGLEIVAHAIRNGMINAPMTGALVHLCIKLDSCDAAEMLLVAMLVDRSYPQPQSLNSTFRDDSTLQSLSILYSFSACTKNISFFYRQVQDMISNGTLPIRWLATRQFGSLWIEALKATSSSMHCVAALQFVETALYLIATSDIRIEDPQVGPQTADFLTAMENTFSSIVVTITAMAILSRERVMQEGTPDTTAVHHAYEQMVSALRYSDLLQESGPRSKYSALLGMVVVVYSTSKNLWSFSDANFVKRRLLPADESSDRTSMTWPYHDETAVFISSVAKCCGRALQQAGFGYLKHIHESLMTLITHLTKEEGKVISRWVLDSADAFVKGSVFNLQFLGYAEELNFKNQKHTHRPSPSKDVPAFGNGRAIFRWEEGIGEWVTATPVARELRQSFYCHESRFNLGASTRYPNDTLDRIVTGCPDEYLSENLIDTRQDLLTVSRGSPEDRYPPGVACIDSQTEMTKKSQSRPYDRESDDELSQNFQDNKSKVSIKETTPLRRCRFHQQLDIQHAADDSEDELCS